MEHAFHDGARGGAAPGASPALALLGGAGPGPAGEASRALLERLFALEPARVLRRMPGRETFAWPAGESLVVKRYQGGEARDFWYELLRRARAPRSPGRREWENLAALAADGFDVPRALCWAEERGARSPAGARPGARGARSAVVMERVAFSESLRERLRGLPSADRRPWLERLARLVARLHARGWYHRDLYLHQIVVRADGALVLLDAGRARRERAPRRRWHVKDLAALLSSAPPGIARAEELRFLLRYVELRGLDLGPSARRALARRVARKAARLAAHAPKHVDPGSAA
jgi:serine/threonine protein kinase